MTTTTLDTDPYRGDPKRTVTAWSRMLPFDSTHPVTGEVTHYPAGRWLIERSYAAWYAVDQLGLSFDAPQPRGGNREWQLFEHGTNPNEAAA